MDDSSDIHLRQCKGPCGQNLPATFEYFRPSRSICRKCSNNIRRKTPRPEPAPEGYRRCTKCKEAKPATLEFFPLYKNKIGLGSKCRKCVNALQSMNRHQWRQANIELARQRDRENYHTKHRKEWARKYQQEHRETTRAKGRRFYAANKEKSIQYRREHKEQYNQYTRRWCQRNPEKVRERVRRRRLRKLGISGNHTPAQIQEQLQRQHFRCYYADCGFSKFPRVKKNGIWKYIYHIEHTFPLSRVEGTDIPANDMGYIVLSCKDCNNKKHDKYPWEWPEGGRLL